MYVCMHLYACMHIQHVGLNFYSPVHVGNAAKHPKPWRIRSAEGADAMLGDVLGCPEGASGALLLYGLV